MRLDAQAAGWIGEHRVRTGLGEAFSTQHVEKYLRVAPSHIGAGFAIGGRVAEIAPAVDHPLRRATADAELQPATGWLLLQNGLVLDAGATMRALDELESDIMFLAGPLVFQRRREPRHDQYLAEFFQKEFDHPDPLQATQKRNRVSRRDIRAYVARTYNARLPVSQVVAVTETIDATFSGYVHGAAVHIMDVYDGRKFVLPLQTADRRLSDMMEQYVLYIHRAMMAVAVTAKAFGDSGTFEMVYQAVHSVFTDDGKVQF
jgi:hypothetical protein